MLAGACRCVQVLVGATDTLCGLLGLSGRSLDELWRAHRSGRVLTGSGAASLTPACSAGQQAPPGFHISTLHLPLFFSGVLIPLLPF